MRDRSPSHGRKSTTLDHCPTECALDSIEALLGRSLRRKGYLFGCSCWPSTTSGGWRHRRPGGEGRAADGGGADSETTVRPGDTWRGRGRGVSAVCERPTHDGWHRGRLESRWPTVTGGEDESHSPTHRHRAAQRLRAGPSSAMRAPPRTRMSHRRSSCEIYDVGCARRRPRAGLESAFRGRSPARVPWRINDRRIRANRIVASRRCAPPPVDPVSAPGQFITLAEATG